MSLTMIIGPMFSGKTSEMIRRYHRDKIAGLKCVYYKSDIDTRDTKNEIKSHSGIKVEVIAIESFEEISWKDFDSIYIDEAQFIKDIDDAALHIRDEGKRVTIAALSTNYLREYYPEISVLAMNADEVVLLKAVCHTCHKDNAIYSFRLNSEEKSNILIGDINDYIPLCNDCFNNAEKNKSV